ncbi:hypothetical protein [Amycolatopsis sp. NPDC049868]|uniref:hypothetical protein n=1 Tax=Amycolatopsis sp. NPDC049868 TaxID=3363934 RepID=UPI0037B59CE2
MGGLRPSTTRRNLGTIPGNSIVDSTTAGSVTTGILTAGSVTAGSVTAGVLSGRGAIRRIIGRGAAGAVLRNLARGHRPRAGRTIRSGTVAGLALGIGFLPGTGVAASRVAGIPLGGIRTVPGVVTGLFLTGD